MASPFLFMTTLAAYYLTTSPQRHRGTEKTQFNLMLPSAMKRYRKTMVAMSTIISALWFSYGFLCHEFQAEFFEA